MVTTALTRMVARLLLAPVLIVAAAILVKGYVDVGDGFAAAVIAALGVLTQYVAFGRHEAERSLALRRASRLAVGGLLLALVVAFAPYLMGDALLEHAPRPGAGAVTVGTLELITAVVFDVGIFLLVLGVALSIIHFIADAASAASDGEHA